MKKIAGGGHVELMITLEELTIIEVKVIEKKTEVKVIEKKTIENDLANLAVRFDT